MRRFACLREGAVPARADNDVAKDKCSVKGSKVLPGVEVSVEWWTVHTRLSHRRPGKDSCVKLMLIALRKQFAAKK